MTLLRRIFGWIRDQFRKPDPLDEAYERSLEDYQREEYKRSMRHGG